MANLLQSSQTQATTAPSYYTNYLSGLASAGQAAQQNAQYVGAQPLQTMAFCQAQSGYGAYNPTIQSGAGYNAQGACAAKSISSSANPYLQAGTSSSPVSAMSPYASSAMGTSGTSVANPLVSAGAGMSGASAANPYLTTAATNNPAAMAQSYMNPYICSAVNKMSDIAQRNIQQNLAPQATAAAVGSGQFGSQRGAQVLGQVENNAMTCLNNSIANMLSSGYGQALCAAGKQQALLGQLGSTAGSLTNQQAQNAITAGTNLGQLTQSQNQVAAGLAGTSATAQNQQNLANLQAAATAGCLAAKQSGALTNAGQVAGGIGTAGTNARLACINALATLGAQQQTIGQNQQLFPLTTLGSLASLLQGYTQPTTTQTTLCMSPLSAAGTAISSLAGLTQQPISGYTTQCVNGVKQLVPTYGSSALTNLGSTLSALPGQLSSLFGGSTTSTPGTLPSSVWNSLTTCQQNALTNNGANPVTLVKEGGSIGCHSTQHRGALPYSE
jgi:hypothetical protein